MKTVGDLITAIKRFVYNNSNAVDSFQGEQSGIATGTFMDEACLQAVNNARKWAERNGSFSWLDVTVAANFPVGLGVNLDRLYLNDENGGTTPVYHAFGTAARFKYDASGQVYVAVPSATTDIWGDFSYLNLKKFVLPNPCTIEDFTIPAKTYTVLKVLADQTVASIASHLFMLDYKIPGVTNLSTWDGTAADFGPSTFNTVARLNMLASVEYVGTTGERTPLTVDTRQGQMIRRTNEMNINTYPTEEPASDRLVPYSNGDPRILQDGRWLRTNFGYDTAFDVEITGSRWMDDYTAETDTDPLVEDGFDFMMWQSIVELNHIVNVYVPRSEGSLPPPEKAAASAWASLLVNDAFATTSYYHQS